MPPRLQTAQNESSDIGQIPNTTADALDTFQTEAHNVLNEMDQANDAPESETPATRAPSATDSITETVPATQTTHTTQTEDTENPATVESNATEEPETLSETTTQQPVNPDQQTRESLQNQAMEIKESAFGQLVTYSKNLPSTAERRSSDSTSNKILSTATKIQGAAGIGTAGISSMVNTGAALGGIASATITPTEDNKETVDNIHTLNSGMTAAGLLLKAWVAFTSFTGGILAAWNGVKQAQKQSETGKLSFWKTMKVTVLSSFSSFLTSLLSVASLASKIPMSKTAQVMISSLSDIATNALPLLNAAIKFLGLQKRMSQMKKEQEASVEIASATKDYYAYLTKQRNRQIGTMALSAPILGLKMVSAALQWTMQFAPQNSAHVARAKKGLAITNILASSFSAVKSGTDMVFAASTLSSSQEEATENYTRFMALTTPDIYIEHPQDANQTQLENSIKQYRHVQKCMELFQIPIPAMSRALSQQEQKEIFFSAFGLPAAQAVPPSNGQGNTQTA